MSFPSSSTSLAAAEAHDESRYEAYTQYQSLLRAWDTSGTPDFPWDICMGHSWCINRSGAVPSPDNAGTNMSYRYEGAKRGGLTDPCRCGDVLEEVGTCYRKVSHQCRMRPKKGLALLQTL